MNNTLFGRFLKSKPSTIGEQVENPSMDEIQATLNQHREELDKINAENEKLKSQVKKGFDKVRAELDQAR